MTAIDLAPGFADPVLDSQGVYRTILHAASHPGTVCELPVEVEAPAPLTSATAAICLTLFDNETPVWLQDRRAESWLRFHCGSPIALTPAQARFALIHDVATMPPFDRFEFGNDEYPDRSTTLIIQVSGFSDNGLVLRGPGIRDSVRFGVQGLPSEFFDAWRGLAPLFPCGIDLFFTVGMYVAAMPRTTRIGG